MSLIRYLSGIVGQVIVEVLIVTNAKNSCLHSST